MRNLRLKELKMLRLKKNKPLLLIFLTLLTSFGNSHCQIQKDGESILVKTQQGQLRGAIGKSRELRDYFAFQGISYAKVQGRFEPSEEPDSWEGIKDAIKFGAECPQIVYFANKIEINSEECLFLNVYTPSMETVEKLPVMVWIHGGGFWEGAGSQYGPDFFMDGSVVLVTINYRLGVLGFLNTGDGLIPGNNGLRDMIMALKWVQNNIQSFHGDPNRVTIFGESAGAFAVHYLMLSPAAKGLFHQAISQSGTALSPFAFVANPTASNELLADLLRCPKKPTDKLVECLKTQGVEALLSAQKNITFPSPPYIYMRFAPSVDSSSPEDGNKDSRIVPATPYELMTNRLTPDVPFIIGLNEDEGLISAAGYLATPKLMDDLNENWLTISPETFGYKDLVPEDQLVQFGSQLRQIYMGNENFSLDREDDFVDMYSHYWMYRGTKITAELTAQHNPKVYPFVFTHRGSFSISNFLGITGRAPSHADELQYLFNTVTFNVALKDLTHDTDIEFSKKFIKLWASFASTGKPTATWGFDWDAANVTNQPLGTPLPWYSLHQKPKPFQYSQEAEDKLVKMDILYAKYEKPQRSWRGSLQQKDEL